VTTVLPLTYRLATATLPAAAFLWPAGHALARARRESGAALAHWALASRDRSRPLVVLHAASAGELRQAEPVIRRLRLRRPHWQLVVTYFSPSGAPVASQLPVDATGHSPWDTAGEVTAFLDTLEPTAIVCCKHDLWPAMAGLAHARGIRLGMIAATVRPSSSRLRWPARALLERVYPTLKLVGAVSDEDARALGQLGVPPARIELTGDPRYDSVSERLEGASLPALDPEMLVAGSTWPTDEEILLVAFRQVLEQRPNSRLLLVPHRPSAARLRRLRRRARAHGLPTPVSLQLASQEDSLVVSEQVGTLAFDYARGGIAYVGGGFRPGGVHSVLEPAALQRPVLAGPEARDSRDARMLNQAEALVYLPRRRPAAVLEAWWVSWARDPAWRSRAGRLARRVVEEGAGAADRSVALIERLVES
jgi:3-deoxy-D-manno-octulosonic-acid transferase